MSAETTAITSTTALQSTIDTMKREVGLVLVVRDANEYAAVAQRLIRIRALKKQIGYLLDPGIQSATAHLNELREGKARYVRQIDELDATASRPAEDWKRREREAEQSEERRINEQRRVEAARVAEEERKAAIAEADRQRKIRLKEIEAADLKRGEANKLRKQAEEEAERKKQQAVTDAEAAKANVQDVTVKPNVPTVAGVRAHVNWKFKMKDENKLMDAFREQRMELRPFVEANLVEIGRMVRETKDKTKAEARCPGIEVWSEDAI